jgi:hypothetical protein
MVYAYTKRDFWNGWSTGFKFLMSTLVLGLATVWLSLMLATMAGNSEASRATVARYGTLLCQSLMLAAVVKLVVEAALFRHLAARHTTSLKRSALLMSGALAPVTMARFAAGLLGGLVMPGFLLLTRLPSSQAHGQDLVFIVLVAMLFTACLAGELLERYLFFTAVASPTMPGSL